MKKNKVNNVEYDKSMMPHNRWQLFKDIFKQNYRKLILEGLFILLSFLPSLAVLFFKDYYIASLEVSFNNGLISEADLIANSQVATILGNSISCLLLFVFALIASGLSRVNYLLTTGEPIFFLMDFNQGVKDNFKVSLIYTFIYSILLTIGLFIKSFITSGIGAYLFLGIVQGIYFPILLTIYYASPIYSWKNKDYFHNSGIFFIRHFLKIFPMSLLISVPAFLLFIPIGNTFIYRYLVIALAVFLFSPILSIVFGLFFNYIFDISINKDHYPELYDKGIVRLTKENDMKREYVFKNNKIVIDYASKTISSIIINDEELIKGNVSFFSVKLRNRNDEVTWIDGKEFALDSLNDKEAIYSHKLLGASIKVHQTENGLNWSIKIYNKTDLLIEQVELMSFGVNKLFVEEGGTGEIYVPYNEGALVKNMAKREASPFNYKEAEYPSRGIYFVFPNMISSQFISYNSNGNGIYLAMYDKEYTPKHIDFKYDDECVKVLMRTFTNVNYGEDYEMDYISTMELYNGNYYDAAEIYRKWFKNNLPVGLKTIEENYDKYPKWYHESPLVITYPVCGKKDADTEMKPGKFYPYTNAIDAIRHFAKETDCKTMTLLMQWESTAPWAPPYVWPPYGDVNNFNEFVKTIHDDGNYIGLYTSGFGWTQKSFRREYNKEDEFEKDQLASIMCTNSKGEMTSTIVSNIRKGYDLCPSAERSKELIVNETEKIINANIDYVQVLDQNHGGSSYFCYSDKHGHIPAPGKWQVEETNSLLERIDTKNSLIGCETAASEPFIKNLPFSDNRLILNQYIGESIPLYAYIYHEYVNNFMGNGICNLIQNYDYSMPYRFAYSFLAGDLLAIVIDDEARIHTSWCIDDVIDEKIPLSFVKELMKYRKDEFYGKFLHMGKMIKPLEVKCDVMDFPHELYDTSFKFPAVLSTAYEYKDKKIQFLVNYTLTEQKVIVNDKEMTIEPLSVKTINI